MGFYIVFTALQHAFSSHHDVRPTSQVRMSSYNLNVHLSRWNKRNHCISIRENNTQSVKETKLKTPQPALQRYSRSMAEWEKQAAEQWVCVCLTVYISIGGWNRKNTYLRLTITTSTLHLCTVLNFHCELRNRIIQDDSLLKTLFWMATLGYTPQTHRL